MNKKPRVPQWLAAAWCVSAGVFLPAGLASAQAYLDNETQYSNQDPNTETRRSDHFRLCFGHYNRDTGTPMTEQLVQGNLQMYEQMWNRWVVEMGLHDINESATTPRRQQIPGQLQFPDDLERRRRRRRLFEHGRQRLLLRHGQLRLLPLSIRPRAPPRMSSATSGKAAAARLQRHRQLRRLVGMHRQLDAAPVPQLATRRPAATSTTACITRPTAGITTIPS